MALLFPLGLLALAAWLVPLLVHLARRHQYAPLDFAALRWLRAKVRPRQRVRFDEWPLLLVRLALLAALALLLARPVLQGSAADTHPVVVVAPGLDVAAQQARQPNADWRWLAPGFPPLEQPAPTGAQPLVSLLRELDQQLPAGTPLTVYVPDPMPGADAERPRLSRNVQWQPLAVAPPSAARPTTRAPRLHLGVDADAQAQRVFSAVQRAWSAAPLAPASTAVPGTDAIGVWPSTAPLPPAWQAWLAGGGTVLGSAPTPPGAAGVVVLRDAQGQAVLSEYRVGSGRLLRFHAAVSPAASPALRDPHFPRQLLHLVRPVAAPQWVAASAHAPVRGARAPAPQPRDLAPWLLGVIVLLFALERWLATSPRRGGTA
ncbi:BatA domain-containing protein [Stenotrophomonas sp. 2619]|uniref:BatA domain-containing protein n=1 Tax=Stenotrophomonas sp. 2619 TaxID=3156316 RepID=UPI00339798DA